MVKISAQSEHFSVLVPKVSHSKFWLFKPIFRHVDPESGFRIRIPAQIECGSNRIRIRNTGENVPACVATIGFSRSTARSVSFPQLGGLANIFIIRSRLLVSDLVLSFKLPAAWEVSIVNTVTVAITGPYP